MTDERKADVSALKARLERAETDARELSWMWPAAAAALAADGQACARCGEELAPEDGAVSTDRDRRTMTRVCDPCAPAWMTDHPEHYMVRALDVVKRDRARGTVH